MVWFVRLDFLAATGAAEPVVSGIGVADTDFRFKVPMVTENPCIAVCHTGTDEPALIAGVFEPASVGTQKIDFTVDAPDVVLASVNVYTDEMTGKAVAEPVTPLGLHHPSVSSDGRARASRR